VNAFVTALLLILPISALAARRLPLSSVVKMALMWVAIFAVLIAVVLLWQQGVGHT
jgi:aspartyl protease family protein